MEILICKTILEGLGLGALLVSACMIGIRKGPVGLVHLYEPAVQERCVKLGLTTKEQIRRRALRFKAVCLPIYIAYLLVCVYAVNGARGFIPGFWQMLVILLIMNCVDRFGIDDFWVGQTRAWIIPGTEDLMPYISKEGKLKKWLMGTAGMAALSAILSGVMTLIL